MCLRSAAAINDGGYAFELDVREGMRCNIRAIAEGPTLTMFAADLPAVATLSETKLLASWEAKDESGGRYPTTN